MSEIELCAELHAARQISHGNLPEFAGEEIAVRLIQIDPVEEVEELRAHLETRGVVQPHIPAQRESALKGTSGPINVSINGGFDPRWRADGRELFYVSLNGMLMSAELTSDDPPRVIQTKPLFKTSVPHPTAPFLSGYVVTRDGARFLINEPLEPPGSIPITVTLQWPRLLAAAR